MQKLDLKYREYASSSIFDVGKNLDVCIHTGKNKIDDVINQCILHIN